MRILGDLDGNEGQGPLDLSGSKSDGKNGNHQDENSSPASSGEPAEKDAEAVEPGEQTDFTAQKAANEESNAFVGGVPPAHPPAYLRDDAPPHERVNDRIGEQRLEPAGDLPNRAQLSPRSAIGGLWFVSMVLAFATIGASAYLYLGMRNNNVSLSKVPELLQSIPALGGRMDATEAKLRDLTANWDGLTNHLAELDNRVDSGLKATRNQTRAMVGQATGRLQGELDRMDQRTNGEDARLNKVESMQRQDHAQLAQLNDQLRGQVASLHEQLTATQENTGHDLANMQEQVSNNEGNLHTLTRQLHRDKVTFEIVKNSPTELAPGVTLTVLKTDASYQRFRGYISLTNEGKTLWLNNQNAKEAVDLYSQTNSHPYSLIVTAVNDDGVVGYLLLPAGA